MCSSAAKMTDLREYYSNGINEESVPPISSSPIGTVEDMLAKYLTDFVIEDDTVLGYINDLNTFKEILESMKNLGFAFSVRDSDARQKQRQKLRKNEEEAGYKVLPQLTIFYQLKAMPIKFFGLPFTIDKTTHYQCAYGCKYYKSRAGCTKLSAGLRPIKKKKNVGSKKMGCLAKMTVKHITVYPDYKLEIESDWRKKKKLIERLRKDLSDPSKVVEDFQRFYLSVSVQSSHNHPPIIIKPKLKVPKPHRLFFSRRELNVKGDDWAMTENESTSVVEENDWSYEELASSSVTAEGEPCSKTLNLRDETFFHTLVKFPNTSGVFEQAEYKPNQIEIEVKPFEFTENTPTIEVYEYQPSIQDLQTLFKEKLKNLYTLCTNCSNGSLILKLAGELEQVEMQLSNDVNYSNL